MMRRMRTVWSMSPTMMSLDFSIQIALFVMSIFRSFVMIGNSL